MIEIQELIIQARVTDVPAPRTNGGPQTGSLPADQEAWIQQVVIRVLAHLRDQQEDWA